MKSLRIPQEDRTMCDLTNTPCKPKSLYIYHYSLIKIKMFWVNPKHIAIQMFLEFLWRHNLSKHHTKHIPKSENMFVVFFFISFFFFFSCVRFSILCNLLSNIGCWCSISNELPHPLGFEEKLVNTNPLKKGARAQQSFT